MIEAQGVAKSYGNGNRRIRALAPISLEGAAGELVWLSGPSGSGKSTLLGVLGLLIRPDSGRLHLDGIECDGLTEGQRDGLRQARIGIVPQSPRMFPELSAERNVMLALTRPDQSLAREAMTRVGLADMVDQPIGTLSGGEQQRVSIARALVKSPGLILADEPSSGLDDDNAAGVFRALARASERGAAVIVASHDSRLAPHASRSVVLSAGRSV